MEINNIGRKWIVKEPGNPATVRRLAQELGTDPVLANLLVQRGITTYEEARTFFRPDLSMLHDPFLMKDMDKAVSRIRHAVNNYKKIADATHAYTDPMVAYDYMRKANASYYYNISTPDKTNKKYRMGWLNRSALSYTPYGLYVPTIGGGEAFGLKYSSTLDDWESTAIKLAQSNASGYVKIMDWGADPESINKITNSTYDYVTAIQSYSSNSLNSTFDSYSNGAGAYGGHGGVFKLGNYTNAPEMKIIHQQTQNRENVLKTLIEGSYTPNDVKRCDELISSEKKKNKKLKSET